MESLEQPPATQVLESEIPGTALNVEVVHPTEVGETIEAVPKNLDVAGTDVTVGGAESISNVVLVAEPADSTAQGRSLEAPDAVNDVQLSAHKSTEAVEDGNILSPAGGSVMESTYHSTLPDSPQMGMATAEDVPLGDDIEGPHSEDSLRGNDVTADKISSTEQGEARATGPPNEDIAILTINEPEVRRSRRARKPRDLSLPSSKPPVRVARNDAREGEGIPSEADKPGTHSHKSSGASNLTARTPMSPLIAAAAANSKKPTPTKSLPSKMERMQFHTSVELKPESPRVPEKKRLQTHVRQQNSAPRLKVAYNCQKCNFRTTRMENLVRHNKAECAFVKDFFSWDANTFSEVAKKRAASPSDIEMDTTPGVTATLTTTPKRKGLPRQRLESPTKAAKVDAAEKTRGSAPVKRKTTGSADEENSDTDNGPPPPAEGTSCDLEFSEDDVVWVEWKRLHWPALVLKIYPNTRKAKVFLIDSISSKETVMINVKKVFNFNSAERNKRFLNEGRVGRNSGALVKAAQKAEEFLRKRCLGIHINAKQFFCDGQVQFIDYSDASSESHLGSELWSCSPASCEEDEDRQNAEASKERRKQRNVKLVECIKAGKADSHLLGVLNGSIPSKRHEMFRSNMQREHLKLKQLSWFGPIDNPDQQEEIYEHCFELLKGNPNVHDTFDIASYVIEVCCPEAVMKALSRTRHVDMARAEKILTRAVVLTKAEHEMTRREMLAISPTPEERKEHEEQIRSNLRDMGINDEILAALNF